MITLFAPRMPTPSAFTSMPSSQTRSEEHTSELQSRLHLVCRLLLEKKKTLFFPPGNDTAALLSAFATYAAGFLVRPFGALIFGRIDDLVGRTYTFLLTIVVMVCATFAVGLLPTFATIGWLAPILLVSLRLLQGLALGGEYGGAATYVAENARPDERGYATSLIPTYASLGFF